MAIDHSHDLYGPLSELCPVNARVTFSPDCLEHQALGYPVLLLITPKVQKCPMNSSHLLDHFALLCWKPSPGARAQGPTLPCVVLIRTEPIQEVQAIVSLFPDQLLKTGYVLPWFDQLVAIESAG